MKVAVLQGQTGDTLFNVWDSSTVLQNETAQSSGNDHIGGIRVIVFDGQAVVLEVESAHGGEYDGTSSDPNRRVNFSGSN